MYSCKYNCLCEWLCDCIIIVIVIVIIIKFSFIRTRNIPSVTIAGGHVSTFVCIHVFVSVRRAFVYDLFFVFNKLRIWDDRDLWRVF